MEKYSEWNKIDLHIHSKESNKVKDNDYEGNEYNADLLLDKLSNEENKINIFSITDHNCLNKKLYNDLELKIKMSEFENKINYIVGVELDINDPSIYKDIFHCLCFFETKDINLISKSIDEIFDCKDLKERNDKAVYPTIQKIFRCLANNKIENILLIPHFNNKSKGLPSDIAIENLNYLCFNAYEDSNNIQNIQKSLKIYRKAGYDNFPFAVFTDNHNLEKYPKDKNDNNNDIKCWILGNIKEPFNAVKTAFQEAKMRISLSTIDGMRKIDKPPKYIDHININGIPCALSPYQNTIVGKFGSGKSLLLHKIKNGSESLKSDDKYSDFYDENENFKLTVGTQKYNSLNELSESKFKIYEFIQQEDYYYKNTFTLENAKKLFEQLNIEHEFKEEVQFIFNKDELIKSFNEINEIISKTDGKNNLNYERAFDNNSYYYFNTTYSHCNIKALVDKLSEISGLFKNVEDLNINGVSIFSEEEKNKVVDVSKIINDKMLLLEKMIEGSIENKIIKILDNYNNLYINNNAKSLKDTLVTDLNELKDKLKNFKLKCDSYESVFPQSKYNELKQPKESKIIDNYSISWKYIPELEYKSIVDESIKSGNRVENLFKSVLKTLFISDKQFSSNKTFDSHIEKYINYTNSLFTKDSVRYDILKDNESLLRKSAGEKSSLFIEFIFDLLEKDLKEDIGILLILDQPEDNIDNDNIFNQISNRIRNLKYMYNNFQSIIVTHNANVAITADSENIIIAKEHLDKEGCKKFIYEMGCIENKEYIDMVCKILEGGKDAMEKRTLKYGINIIRKVNQNGI